MKGGIHKGWVTGIITLGFLISTGSVGATSITVCNSGCNYTTIQEAINAANDGDTINIVAGTYMENVDVTKSVNLVGAGAGVTIVNASNPNDHVFEVTANWTNVSGFTVAGSTNFNNAGIYLYGVEHCKISNNNASNNYNGIYLESSSNYNTIANNIAPNNNVGGIALSSSSNNALTNNTAYSNNAYGISLWWHSESNDVIDNIASNNTHGIYLYLSSNNTLTNNTAYSNTKYGIFSWNSNNTIIINNNASKNVYGIELAHSDSNDVIDNTANSNNYYGIRLSYSSNNGLTNNTANSNNYPGIALFSSSNNTISDNYASNNVHGISLDYSSNNALTNNTANSNNYFGIYLTHSSNNTLSNNYFNNTNNFYFGGTIYSNNWNTTKQVGPNIIGGPYLGGNFWANISGTGFSETCADADDDGICDSNYTLVSEGIFKRADVDYLPLAALKETRIEVSPQFTTETQEKKKVVCGPTIILGLALIPVFLKRRRNLC